MSAVKITDRLTVASQPDIGRFADIARDYAALINLRPDGEDAAQPGNSAEHAAATDAKLGYAFLPVTGSTITEADIRAFQHAMNSADGPFYAHCKGGTRVLTLYVLGEVLDGRMRREEVEAFGKARGFDLSRAARWLARQSAYKPAVKGFYDVRTGSIQYVVSDPATKRCAIIDPIYDFDEKSGATGTTNADAILAYIGSEGLTVEWILDTHPHADHFSAAHYLKAKTGAPTAIGAHVTDVQKLWKAIYNWPDFPADGSQWDRLFNHGDTFRIGTIEGRILFSPGHTLASITYVIGDAAFVHDTIFMPDSGTARTDFPGGSAQTLWASIQRILALPDDTRVYCAHEYTASNARFALSVDDDPALAARAKDIFAARERGQPTVPTTIGLEKATNPFLRAPLLAGRVGAEGAPAAQAFAAVRAAKDSFKG